MYGKGEGISERCTVWLVCKGVGCRAVVTCDTPGVTGNPVTTVHICWVDDDEFL